MFLDYNVTGPTYYFCHNIETVFLERVVPKDLFLEIYYIKTLVQIYFMLFQVTINFFFLCCTRGIIEFSQACLTEFASSECLKRANLHGSNTSLPQNVGLRL